MNKSIKAYFKNQWFREKKNEEIIERNRENEEGKEERKKTEIQ